MWPLAFGSASYRRRHIVGAIERVVGRWRHQRPMGLDVGQMQHPGPIARLANELQRAVGHVGCFGVRLGDSGRTIRVTERPARQDAAVFAKCRVGMVMPGIVARVAKVAQITVIAKVGVRFEGRMDAVIAFVGFEAALRKVHAQIGTGIHAQTVQSLNVRHHVGLANQRHPGTRGLQIVAQRTLINRQRHKIPAGTMAEGRAARVERHARGPANRRTAVGPVEPHAARGDAVDVGGVHRRLPVAGEVVPAELVRHDEQHVARFAHVADPALIPSRCSRP